MKEDKAKIEMMHTAQLIPYARNSRTHSEAQVAQIAGSIREFGFTNPVLIDAKNGIIAGHGRVMAAQLIGMDIIPCIRLAHLTDTQRKAYIIADNKLALNSGWDDAMLGLELAELREVDFDLGLIGFSEDELGAFDVDESAMPDLADGDKQPFQQMTFTVHDEQAEDVQVAIEKAKKMGHGESAVNENSNGNALAFICQSFNRFIP
jgi:ParB-like chromosome segregation protein Spo0J